MSDGEASACKRLQQGWGCISFFCLVAIITWHEAEAIFKKTWHFWTVFLVLTSWFPIITTLKQYKHYQYVI